MSESSDPVRAALSIPVSVEGLTRLDGQVAVVTGTSSGLGQRFARVFDAAGASVVLASRRHDADVELADMLRDALAVRCDVRSPADRQTLVASAVARFGGIDILVNNAGAAHSEPAETEPEDSVRELLETNLVSLYALTQLVAQDMLARGSGVIVNVASPAAMISLDRYPLAGYGASKAGVVALTRELAAQWGSRGVRVNALAPSFFPSASSGWLIDPDQVAWISAHAVLGRAARAEELDGPLLFLASDASSYITGQTLLIDGGWSCR
jgi:NAD(P)-dependent dehydrogenase (short-subunit alcohol dehydrogenase family)